MFFSTDMPIFFGFISLYIIMALINKFYSKASWLLPFNLFILFSGASLAFMPSKIPLYLTSTLMLISVYYTYRSLENNSAILKNDVSAVTSFITRFSFGGDFTKWFPIVGLFLVFLEIASLKWFYSSRFGHYDFLMVTLALIWFFYNTVPSKFARERDFLFIFFNALVAILILPEIVYDLIYQKESSGPDSAYGRIVLYSLLTKPLENLLTLTGYEASAHGDILSFWNNDGTLARVQIAEMCSGLYSFAIFSSALIAFFGTAYNRFHNSIALLMTLGILITYFANLLRMYVIVLAGHYWGPSALFWAHNNIGWIIFLCWNGIFWFFVMKYTTFLKENKQI